MIAIIQKPYLNEAEALGLVLAESPRTIPGMDSVESLVADDGTSSIVGVRWEGSSAASAGTHS
jgi:hypothetical protein